MKVKPCDKPCVECGFKKDSQVGVLQPEILDFIKNGNLFPCHMKLKEVTGSENTGVELYKATQEVIYVCRGYVESVVKSSLKMPNQFIWEDLINQVKNDLHDDIMDIQESLKYHGRY